VGWVRRGKPRGMRGFLRPPIRNPPLPGRVHRNMYYNLSSVKYSYNYTTYI